jgi:ATP-dependent DNA helicase RecQ
MQTSQQLLKHYFGYDTFRYPQEEIIQSVLDGKDTLALLPTGGGKSVCFQIPALMKEGICIVVSPLIALMKDQVMQLKKRDIKAAAIFSGLSYSEIDIILDNCQFGYYKFLYVSPERLKTEIFIERFKRMNVNLIAVDEAHCVSQWGYDFRPPYLEIAEIKKFHPSVPIIALTASATPTVQNDITDKLQLKKATIFKKSFLRNNLSFVVRREEAKYPKLLDIIQKLKGSGMVYVRNRNKTKDVAEYLTKNKINADFYHAGLSTQERNAKQENWINNKTQVIVCTNAFGMGIDKPNVRFVVHLDIPESLEAYYQEAGRAGRDGKLSYTVMLFTQSDIDYLWEKNIAKFPPMDVVKNIYNAVCNHLGIAVGSGKMLTYDFDMSDFCTLFKLDATTVYNCLKILQQENYMQLSESIYMPSRAIFKIDSLNLYKYEVANSSYSAIIKALLRMYGGILDHYIKISESQIARVINITETEVVKQLKFLQRSKILTYIPANDKPTILLLNERLHDNNLRIDTKYLLQRKQVIETQLKAMIYFVEQSKICRQTIICNYFGEKDVEKCGKCDICLEEKKKLEANEEFKKIKEYILLKTNDNWVKIDDILPKNAHFTLQLYKEVIRFMLDEKLLQTNEKNEIKSV